MSWLTDWKYRYKLTIDGTKVDAALTDIPILLHLSTAAGITDTDLTFLFSTISYENRKKIAVTTDDEETQLYVEIVTWDATNKHAVLYVKASSLSAGTDSILYLYFDSSKSANTTYVGDKESTPGMAVWSDYNMVLHLNEQGTGVSGEFKDSTDGNRDGQGAAAPDLVSGLVYKCQKFNGVDDQINISHHADLIPADITVEALISYQRSWKIFNAAASPYIKINSPYVKSGSYAYGFTGKMLNSTDILIVGLYTNLSSVTAMRAHVVSCNWSVPSCSGLAQIDLYTDSYLYDSVSCISLENNKLMCFWIVNGMNMMVVNWDGSSLTKSIRYNYGATSNAVSVESAKVTETCVLSPYWNSSTTIYAKLFKVTSGVTVQEGTGVQVGTAGAYPSTRQFSLSMTCAKVTGNTYLITWIYNVSTSYKLRMSLVSVNSDTLAITVLRSNVEYTLSFSPGGVCSAYISDGVVLINVSANNNNGSYYSLATISGTQITWQIGAVNYGTGYSPPMIFKIEETVFLHYVFSGYSYKCFTFNTESGLAITSELPASWPGGWGVWPIAEINNDFHIATEFSPSVGYRQCVKPEMAGKVFSKLTDTGGVTSGYALTLLNARPIVRLANSSSSYTDYTGDTDMLEGLHHIAFTVDASKNFKMYMDGVEVATGTSAKYDSTGTSTLSLGMGVSDTARYNGQLGDVRIFPAAKSIEYCKVQYHALNDSLITYGSIEQIAFLNTKLFFDAKYQSMMDTVFNFPLLQKDQCDNMQVILENWKTEYQHVPVISYIWYGDKEDLGTVLYTHGPSLEDTATFFHSGKFGINDLLSFFSAFYHYRGIDVPLFCSTLNRTMLNFKNPLTAGLFSKTDIKFFLHVTGLGIPSISIPLAAWKKAFTDTKILLYTCYEINMDCRILCAATDKNQLQDCGISCAAIILAPTFKYLQFQSIFSAVTYAKFPAYENISMNLEVE